MLDALDSGHIRRVAAQRALQTQEFADPSLTAMAQAIAHEDTVTLQRLVAVKPPDWLILNRDGDTLVSYAIKNALDPLHLMNPDKLLA